MSRNVKGWRVAPILCLLTLPALAQEKLATMPEVMEMVANTEVYLTGYIGRGPEGVVRFVLPDVDDNGFPVMFESDENLDARIEGCGFNGSGGLPCRVAAYGYLAWEGTRLKIMVTSIETLDPPKLRE